MPVDPIDLGGWHTASAVTYRALNEAIIAQGVTPSGIQYTSGDGSAAIDGTFGPWSLTVGAGAGTRVMLNLPITSGTFTLQGTPQPIVACDVGVSLGLAFVPQDDGLQVLVPTGDEPITVETVTPSQGDTTTDAVFKQVIQNWLEENLDDFRIVFGSVNLDADYALEGLTWLTPSYVAYAVAEPITGATLDNSIFGILCLIDGEEPSSSLEAAIPLEAIPEGKDAAFLISQQKFIQHMLLDAVPFMFKGIEDEPATTNFRIENDGTTIVNIKDLELANVKVKDKDRNPKVEARDFTIEADGPHLKLNLAKAKFEYSLGIYIVIEYDSTSTLGYDSDNGILKVTVVEEDSEGACEVSKGIEIAEAITGIASIVLTLVGALGGTVSRTASAAIESAEAATLGSAESISDSMESFEVQEEEALKILGGIISGDAAQMGQIGARASVVMKVCAVGLFCTGSAWAVPTIMQAVLNGDYEKPEMQLSSLTDAAVGDTIIWPRQAGDFTLSSAELNGAMIFGLTQTAPAA